MLRWKDYYESEELRQPVRDSDAAHMEYLATIALAPALVVWTDYSERRGYPPATRTPSGPSWTDGLAWMGQRLIDWGEWLGGRRPATVAGDAVSVAGNTPG